MTDEQFAEVALLAARLNNEACIKACSELGHDWGRFFTYPLKDGLAWRSCKRCSQAFRRPCPGEERHWEEGGKTFSGPPLSMDEIVVGDTA